METAPVFREADLNNLEFVRQIILGRLRHDDRWNQFDYDWDRDTERFVTFEQPELRYSFITLASEVMWQFIMQGIITPGTNSYNMTIPWFRITDYGQRVIDSEQLIPHDPTGYLSELRLLATTTVGGVALAYLEEALRCFNAGCHVASVLLLGVAAESVFLKLCEVIASSLSNPSERQEFSKKQVVKHKHRWIVDKYQSLPSAVRRDQLPESLDMTLLSLYELIRRQRNEIGHPQDTPPALDREQAFILFRLFPGFVRDVEGFAAYCQANGL